MRDRLLFTWIAILTIVLSALTIAECSSRSPSSVSVGSADSSGKITSHATAVPPSGNFSNLTATTSFTSSGTTSLWGKSVPAPSGTNTNLQYSGSNLLWAAGSCPASSYYPLNPPSNSGYVEWDGDPQNAQSASTAVSQTLYLVRLTPQTGGLIANVNAYVGTAGSTLTAALTTNVTGTSSGTAGRVKLAVGATAGISTNNIVTVTGVVGTIEANGAWLGTVVDGTHLELQGTTWANAWTSGGTVVLSHNLAAVYSSTGTFLTATFDQVSAWGTPGAVAMQLAAAPVLNAAVGTPYYLAILSNGSGTQPAFENFGSAAVANANLTAPNFRYSTAGTTNTVLPSSFTPSSNSVTGAFSYWVALN